MMRPAVHQVILALGLGLFLPATQAIEPCGNDADSGGDAGDLVETATPIALGAYYGWMCWPHDEHDVYSLAGSYVGILQVSLTTDDYVWVEVLDSSGRSVAFLGANENKSVPLDGEGPMYLRFYAVGPSADARVEFPYSFSVYLVPATVASGTTDERGWAQFEMAFNDTSRFSARATFYPGVNLTRPSVELVLIELVLWDDRTDEWFHGWVGAFEERGSLGHSVIQPWLEREVDVPLPGVTVVLEGFNALRSFGLWGEAERGWIRVLAYSTADADSVRLGLAVEETSHSAASSGRDVVNWTETNWRGEEQVSTPFASMTGPRKGSLVLDGSFLGLFDAHGQPGRMTSPSGVVTELGDREPWVPLVHPEPGTWTFEVDGSLGVADGADSTYLSGAFVPATLPFGEP